MLRTTALVLLSSVAHGAPFPQCEYQTLRPATLQPGDVFGNGMRVDMETAVITAHGDDTVVMDGGAVHVYERQMGDWQPVAILYPPAIDVADAPNDFAHGGLAIWGDLIAVGARNDNSVVPEGGAVYVFERVMGTWGATPVATLTVPSALPGAKFGASCDLQGSTLVVGATGPLENSAYVFTRTTGGMWSLDATLTADSVAGDNFGGPVRIAGNWIFVGAEHHQHSTVRTGAGYLFEQQGGVWSLAQELLPQDGMHGDQFGGGGSLGGRTLVVRSIFGEHAGTNPDSGAAYVYRLEGGVWGLRDKLFEPGGANDDRFGSGEIVGDLIVLGANGDDNSVGLDAGAVFPYRRCGGTWRFLGKLLPPGGPGDRFASLGMNLDTLFVGAATTNSLSGCVYVYDLCACLPVGPKTLPSDPPSGIVGPLIR